MLYNIAIKLYGIAIKIAAKFNPKAKKWVEGRRQIWSQLPDVSTKKVIWFHCASLGEFEQGRPIIERWKEKNKNDFILITFFSPSGYEVQKDYPLADYCCYLPLDTPNNALRFVNHFNPHTTFFIKYEFWLNYIHCIKENGGQLYALSTIFRPNQRFFKWYGKPFRDALKKFDYFFVQNKESLKLLNSINIKKVVVSGDTRYDRVSDRLKNQENNPLISRWLNEEKAFIVGSSWREDEILLLPFINDNQFKTILAPHEVNKKHIQEILNELKVPSQCYTEASKKGEISERTQVLILDCIGVLADAYQYGNIVYIGGAFRTGLHNIIEPAVYGLPVIFGPKHQKFPEASFFIEHKVGYSISNRKEFENTFSLLLQNETTLNNKIKHFIASQKGAREKVFAALGDALYF